MQVGYVRNTLGLLYNKHLQLSEKVTVSASYYYSSPATDTVDAYDRKLDTYFVRNGNYSTYDISSG